MNPSPSHVLAGRQPEDRAFEPTPPSRSLEQRMRALQRANEIRSERAQLKRDLKAGRASLVELLTDPPEWLLTAKVYDLILELPKIGRVKATKVVTNCRISPSKTLGGLTERQRAELATALDPRTLTPTVRELAIDL